MRDPRPPLRVASLIPSGTEIVAALGLAGTLVGRSHCCDHPAEVVRDLPVLCDPKIDPSRPSGAIDRDVRALMEDGLSVYRVRVDALRAAAPDVVVTQDHCDACAVSLRDVEDAVRCLGLPDARICSLNPHDLAGVEADFLRVADALGVPGSGHALVRDFQRRLEAVRQATAGAARRPRVALVEWLDPPMIAGGWMPELARIAGGEPVVVTDSGHFAEVDWAEIAAAEPDVVVFLPCGYGVERTRRELEAGPVADAARRLVAGAPGGGWIVDGDAYFNRPGPRLADSAALLAEVLHPDRTAGAFSGPPGACEPWPAGRYRTISVPSSRA
ncbi:MAG: ABC transporter substrate-binding protein [Longimicrobiales bacterium]